MGEQAKRVNDYSERDPSCVCYFKQEGIWFIWFPKTELLGNLANHAIEEHEDGTISVSPSIKVTGCDLSGPAQEHGYLTKGVWNEC